MIPTEVLTFATTTGLGAALKLMSKKMEIDKQRFEQAIKKEQVKEVSRESARKFIPPGGPIIRRAIVFTMLFTVFIAPVILAFFHLPVVYAYSEEPGQILWGLFGGGGIEKMKFVEMQGMVILPVHVHIASAISGFYFGTASVK